MHRTLRAARLGALILVLGACSVGGGLGPGSITTPVDATTSTTAAAGGGQVVVGLGGFGSPRTLNPLLDGPDAAVLDVIGPAVFASAYAVEPGTLALVPDALTEIPTVENGGVVDGGGGTVDVTYRVAPWARWSDGTAISAEDLRFTYEVATDPSLPIRRDVRSRYASVVPGSVVADGLTLHLTMGAGFGAELLFGVILPAHQVAGTDFTADWNDRMWVGGGPFSFASWQPGQYLELTRNAYYRGTDPGDGTALPHLDRVVFRFFEESDSAGLEHAFATGALDVAVLSDVGDTSSFAALAARGAAVETAPGLSWQVAVFQFGPANRNAESLNRYPEFREAVARALDRDALAAALGGEVPDSIFSRYLPALASGAWDTYVPDMDRVSSLLWELGNDLGVDLFAGFGPRVVLTASSGDPAAMATAEAAGGMLRAAGIAAEVQFEDRDLFYGETLADGTWDVAVWTLTGGPGLARAVDLALMFDPAGLPRAGAGFARWGAPGSVVEDGATTRYAGLASRLQSASGLAEAESLLRQAESLLADEVVLLPLAVAGKVGVAYWAGEVQGITVDPAWGIASGIGSWKRVGG